MITTKKSWGAAAALAAASLVLVACSSGNDSASSNPNLTKSPIVIGMANATTGAYDAQQVAADEDVAKAWQQWVNTDQGGINGHPVRVVFGDTKNDPATASTVATKLINDEKVIAEVGGADAVTAGVWVPMFNAAKIPVIGGQIVDDSLISANPYYYPTLTPVLKSLPILIDAAKANGATKISGAVCAEAPACKQAVPSWQGRAQQLGIDWQGLTQVRQADPNYTAACLTMKQTGANFIILGISYAPAQRLIADCAQQKLTSATFGFEYGTFDGKLADLTKRTGSSIFGIFGGFPWFMDTPAITNYRDVMTKYGKGVPSNPIQGVSWNGLELFRKAMTDASDNPTAAEVAEKLGKIKDEDLGGLLPQKISYNAPGTPQKPMTCMWGATLANGTLSGGKPYCASN